MKKTQIIELLNTIKNTLISFISITMFVLFGVGIFLGLDWTAKDLKYKLNNRYDEDNFHDLEIYYPYGVSKNDVNRLKKISGIDEIESFFYGFEFFKKDNKVGQAKIVSLTNDIDLYFGLRGRLPENEHEILVEEGSAYGQGLKIGDKVTFYGEEAKQDYILNKITNQDNVNLDELVEISKQDYSYLKCNEVEIVGTIKNPEYISMSKASYGTSNRTGVQVDAIFYTNYDSLNEDIINGYNSVLIKNNNLKNKYTFSDEYLKLSEDFSNDVKDIANQIGKDSYQRVKNKTDNILLDASKALDDAHIELLNAQNDIDKALIEWNDNLEIINDYKKTLNEAKILLQENEEKLNEAAIEIAKGDSELASAIQKYNILSSEIEEFKTTYSSIKSSSERLYEYFTSGMETAQMLVYLSEYFSFDVETIINRENIEIIIDLLSNEIIKENIELLEEFEENKEEAIESIVNFIIDYMEEYYIETDPSQLDEVATYVYEGIIDIKERLQAIDNTRIIYLEALIELAEYDDELYNKTIGEYQSKVDYIQKTIIENLQESIDIINEYFGEDGLYIALINNVDYYINEAFTKIDELLVDANNQIEEGRNLLSSYKAQYSEALNEFKTKKQEYIDGTNELEKGIETLNSAKQKIDDSQKELDEYTKEYEDKSERYNELVDIADQIKDYGTIIQTRNVNPGYIYLELLSNIISKLKTNLGGLFLIISLFICYSVVTRNVFDQSKQIGTKKALGLSQKEVTLSFVLYSGITVIIGGIFGVVLAYCVVEKMLIPLIVKSFTFARYAEYFSFKDALLLIGIEFILIEVITLFACKGVLKTSTVKLLKGFEPASGKKRFYEKFKIWNKLSLLTKTIINNIFNDKQRVFATLIGIIGCTALVVSSIMLRNNVLRSFDKQYEEYFIFDHMVYYDSNNDEASKQIENILIENDVNYSNVYYSIGYVYNDKFEKLLVKEFIYDDIDSFSKLVKFDTHDGKQFDYNGAWLNESVKVNYKLDNQESIILSEINGGETKIDLNGFYKYYFYNPILFMNSTTYEHYFDKDKPCCNTFIIDTENIDISKINAQLENIDGYLNTFNYYQYCKGDAEVFRTIATAIVGLYSFISVLMSIFVLLNLLNTFVMEKKSELIVLMINGFTSKDAKRYIYFDTVIMTIIGVIVGVVVGYFAGIGAIGAFESKFMYLLHDLDFYACIIGASLTIVLTYIMTKVAIKKIDKFKLTDINRIN